MKFSEKYGYAPAQAIAQVESMDDKLRTGLWNVTYVYYLETESRYDYYKGSRVLRSIWISHLHRDLNAFPDMRWEATRALRPCFEEAAWFEVYDLIQAIVEANPEKGLINAYNEMLDAHHAGYRLIGSEVTPLTDAREIEEVESALAGTSRFKGARNALGKALALYSDREEPDYANSIKESISAVEAVARELTGKPTLGAALDQLKQEAPDIHTALIRGWKAIYGYASDEDAIRHGGTNVPEISQDLARYFLISCSAFVNLLMGFAK